MHQFVALVKVQIGFMVLENCLLGLLLALELSITVLMKIEPLVKVFVPLKDGIKKSVLSPGFFCSPQNLCQLSQTRRDGTKKKNVSINTLSMKGATRVFIRTNAFTRSLKVSPGRTSSTKNGIKYPASVSYTHLTLPTNREV